MSQRNNHRLANNSRRPTTIAGGISLRGALIITLVLVLLITYGGAG